MKDNRPTAQEAAQRIKVMAEAMTASIEQTSPDTLVMRVLGVYLDAVKRIGRK